MVCYNNFEVCLFRAAFCLAYFALLRIGELTYTDARQADYPLRFDDIKIDRSLQCITAKIRKSTTSQAGKPTILQIPAQQIKATCPVGSMHNYIHVRPQQKGILFCHSSGLPLTRGQFSAVLSKAISQIGLPVGKFKSHSFHIGRATTLAMEGVSGGDDSKVRPVAVRCISQIHKALILNCQSSC